MAKTDKKKASTARSGSADGKKTEEELKSGKEADQKKTKSPTSSTAAKSNTTKPTHQKLSSSLELLVPPTLGGNGSSGDCNVLFQIDPNDSATLDFEGTTGAIGRFQCDNTNNGSIVLDLKGSQYQGTILPGPTVMIASLYYSANHTQELRLDTITDEFVPLVKTQDTMAKLDGQIMQGTLDESYQLQEEDINIIAKRQEQQQQKERQQQAKKAGKATTTNNNNNNNNNKNGTSSKSSGNSSNKRKAATTTTSKSSKLQQQQKSQSQLGEEKVRKEITSICGGKPSLRRQLAVLFGQL